MSFEPPQNYQFKTEAIRTQSNEQLAFTVRHYLSTTCAEIAKEFSRAPNPRLKTKLYGCIASQLSPAVRNCVNQKYITDAKHLSSSLIRNISYCLTKRKETRGYLQRLNAAFSVPILQHVKKYKKIFENPDNFKDPCVQEVVKSSDCIQHQLRKGKSENDSYMNCLPEIKKSMFCLLSRFCRDEVQQCMQENQALNENTSHFYCVHQIRPEYSSCLENGSFLMKMELHELGYDVQEQDFSNFSSDSFSNEEELMADETEMFVNDQLGEEGSSLVDFEDWEEKNEN